MTAAVLAKTTEMSREEWLEARRKGIGGSDAAAVAGVSRWKSPMMVYLEKIGELAPDEPGEAGRNPHEQGNKFQLNEPGEAAYWGTLLEDIVAREFSNRTGLKVQRRNAILQHPEYPFMIANVDRLIVGEKEGLECKTTSIFHKEEWEDDKIPPEYYIQVQHYMAVTGYEAWWIAVLIGGNKFIHKRIERDDETIQYLIQIEKDFWENHVLAGVMPDPDGSKATAEFLNKLYPESTPESFIRLEDDESVDMLNKYFDIQSQIKSLETSLETIKNYFKEKMEDAEIAYIGDHKIRWKSITSNRFDSKKFQKEHPDLYKQYLRQSSSRRFEIK